jgi:hypothetical protein
MFVFNKPGELNQNILKAQFNYNKMVLTNLSFKNRTENLDFWVQISNVVGKPDHLTWGHFLMNIWISDYSCHPITELSCIQMVIFRT